MMKIMNLRRRFGAGAVAGVVLAVGGRASPQEFVDDFSDGSLSDGEPVSWGPECFWSSGIYDASTGDLVVGSIGQLDATLPADAFFAGDVSVRTQLTIATGSTVDVMAHFNCATGTGYWGEIATESDPRFNAIQIKRFDGAVPLVVLGSAPLPADFVPEKDHLLQLDVRGEVIELRMWKPEEDMPVEPLVSVVDETYRSGLVGLNLRPGDNSPQPGLMTSRFFHASDTMISD